MQQILEMDSRAWAILYFGLIMVAAIALYIAYGGAAVRGFYADVDAIVDEAPKRVPVELPPETPPDALSEATGALEEQEGIPDAQ